MTKHNCSFVSITKRQCLTGEESEKETFHLELDLSNCGINYAVGDCVAIYPKNDPHLVQQILDNFPDDPDTIVKEEITFRDFLLNEANLIRAPRKLMEAAGKKGEYLTDLLPCPLSAKEFCSYLAPIIPRFYSIASSMSEVGKSAHLTVTINKNPPGFPNLFGTCSHYLCHRAPLNEPVIKLYHHPSRTFGLPQEAKEKPIIMVGPGTGIAPFRGFMQERQLQGASAKNWLFFGEQREKSDFYYKEDWDQFQQKGLLQLDTAFSRDSTQKIYVQHKMLEKGAELWKWLQEGAYLFVCGDASKMAKDVEAALQKIIETEGKMSTDDAKGYLKTLKKEKRYLRDVY